MSGGEDEEEGTDSLAANPSARRKKVTMDVNRSRHGSRLKRVVTDTMNRGCIMTVKDANSRRFRRTCEATCRVEDLKIDVMDSVKSVWRIVTSTAESMKTSVTDAVKVMETEHDEFGSSRRVRGDEFVQNSILVDVQNSE